ncbi:MAG TPA: hypothetical protein VMP42_05235 [Actinomycetota bacterium]|nr:hypothetical protein [Actinomycetota bacterium]
MSIFKGSGQDFDEAATNARENVIPALREIDGFAGALILADRSTGRSLAITLWATEDALRSSADAATQMRDETAARYDEEIVAVDVYDIVIDARGESR